MRSGFSIVPLRRIARVQNGGTPGPHESNWEGDVPWATPVDLGRVHGGYLQATERSITATGLQSGSTLAPAGSILISSRAPIGYAAIAGMDTAFNQGCKALIPLPGVSQPRFLKYAVESQMSTLQAAGRGSTFTEVSASDVASLPVPVTSLAKQDRIADYLDRETAEIDAFISDSEQMARLVDERRKAERSVLLRRLNNRVPLKRKARLVTGGTPQEISTTTDSDGVFWIKPGDIGAGRDGTKGNIKLTPHSASQLPAVESEAVVVVGIGSVGKVGFMVPPFVTNQQITTVIPLGSTDPAFLYHVLADSEQWIRNSANGTTLPIINNSILGLVPTPDIPQPEQAEIVEFLDAKERQASEAIAELESAIQLAKERRAALISAAVTGQIDVSTEGMSAAEQLRDDLEVHL